MRNRLFHFLMLLCALIAARQCVSATAPQFVTIYQFGAYNNIPGSELTVGPAGQLFGTTYGGAYSDGAGSVYELTPQAGGTFNFKELYRFDSAYSPPDDGQNPYAGLALSPDGTTLYGTTQNGGSNGLGITFSLQIAAAEGNAVIKPNYGFSYSFDTIEEDTVATGNGSRTTGSVFGDFLTGALFLFGTEVNGGSGDYGAYTMLIIHPGSNDTIIVVVPLQPTTGTHPQGKLAIGNTGASGSIVPHATGFDPANYTAYGITRSGGSNNVGTVYSIRADGTNLTALHHFKFAASDGAIPLGGMVLSGNTLYGTTSSGGTNSAGTVFEINTDGSGFKLLASFNSSTTGSNPQGDLIMSGDTLYGTTYLGGTNGGGTVFSIKTNGTAFTVLHSFQSPTSDGNGHYTNSDGGWSGNGLALSGNVLYGTTPYGGTNGVGTAYEIILPGPPSLNVARSGGNVKIFWPSSATNYVLQSNSTLSSVNWSNTTGFADDGTNRSVLLNNTNGHAFFRLLSTNGL